MPHAAVLPFLLLHLLQDLLLVHGFTTKSEERRWHDACTREVGAAKLRFCMKKARREGRKEHAASLRESLAQSPLTMLFYSRKSPTLIERRTAS